jgi:hypothetical protein
VRPHYRRVDAAASATRRRAMNDRILSAQAAQTLQAESYRERSLLTWIVMSADDVAEVVARPMASGRGPLPYVLVAGSLAELRAMMPAGLTRSERQPADPLGVIEIWMTTGP